MSLRPLVLLLAILGVTACINVDITLCSRDDTSDDTPRVKIDDVAFEVEVADTQLLRDRD